MPIGPLPRVDVLPVAPPRGVGRAEFDRAAIRVLAGEYDAVAAAFIEQLAGRSWQVDDDGFVWRHLTPLGAKTPRQGWKLHLSATLTDAARVLTGVGPVLQRFPTQLKFARSLSALHLLNSGQAGHTQIGKLMTVYPVDDAEAVALALSLHEVTRGLRGPVIPSDLRLAEGSLVFYRYGSFVPQWMVRDGRTVPALVSRDGQVLPDSRDPNAQEQWPPSPFPPVAARTSQRLIGGRFLLIGIESRGGKGTAHIAIDVRTRRRCFAKRAFHSGDAWTDGEDAVARLRNEWQALTKLRGIAGVPEPISLESDGDDLLLLMEDVEGIPLHAYVAATAAKEGAWPRESELIRLGSGIAQIVASIHERGLAHRDLSSSNILVGDAGAIHVIDFEFAGSPHSLVQAGTPGYVCTDPPLRGVQADMYALGRILFFLATGSEPSSIDLTNGASTILRHLRPGTPTNAIRAMQRCDTSISRASSADEIVRLLRREASANRASPPGRKPTRSRSSSATHELKSALEDGIRVLSWSVDRVPDPRTLGLGAGRAGQLVALASLVELGIANPHQLETTISAVSAASHGHDLPDGLWHGKSGIGWAISHAAKVAGFREAEREGYALLQAATGGGVRELDVVGGIAGALLALSAVPDSTGVSLRSQIRIVAEQVLASEPQLLPKHGFAHGRAGVAAALAMAASALNDPRLAARATSLFETVASAAITCRRGTAVTWPVEPGGRWVGPFWCHGATGIGQAALSVGLAANTDRWNSLVVRAARSVAAADWLGVPKCHGLAGSIDFLMNAGTVLDLPQWHRQAQRLAPVLAMKVRQEIAYRHQDRVTSSVQPNGLLDGLSGAMVTLARCLGSDVASEPLATGFVTLRR